MAEFRGRLDGGAAASGADAGRAPSTAAYEALLSMQPEPTAVDARALYDDVERAAFARPPQQEVEQRPGQARLLPPAGLAAVHEARAVSLSWEPGPGNLAYADTLRGDERLAFRVYRSVAGEPSELVATVDFTDHRWRDADLPLAATTVSYEVWTVLLRQEPDGPSLVAAERSQTVTVEVPDHFRLVLVDGNTDGVRVRVEIGPASAPVAAHEEVLQQGQPLVVGGRPTGLVLSRLEIVDEERLVTRQRLVFTSDGGLVLDPQTQTPRTTETQVLMPKRRLVATLTGRLGDSRTLELDLP